MSTDSVRNETAVTNDFCIFEFIGIVPLDGDTDGACTTECDSGDWSAEGEQDDLTVLKQEAEDVCCIGFMSQQFIGISSGK